MTLAKLKPSLKSSLDKVNGDLKEVYSALNKFSKALDKARIKLCTNQSISFRTNTASVTDIQACGPPVGQQ